jgi:hypothetical protein
MATALASALGAQRLGQPGLQGQLLAELVGR